MYDFSFLFTLLHFLALRTYLWSSFTSVKILHFLAFLFVTVTWKKNYISIASEVCNINLRWWNIHIFSTKYTDSLKKINKMISSWNIINHQYISYRKNKTNILLETFFVRNWKKNLQNICYLFVFFSGIQGRKCSK